MWSYNSTIIVTLQRIEYFSDSCEEPAIYGCTLPTHSSSPTVDDDDRDSRMPTGRTIASASSPRHILAPAYERTIPMHSSSPNAADDDCDGCMPTGRTIASAGSPRHIFATGMSLPLTSPVASQLPSIASLFSALGTPAHAPDVQKRGDYRRALCSERVPKSNEAWEITSQPILTARTGNYCIIKDEVLFCICISSVRFFCNRSV
jgi:hypothetical protein